MKQKQYGRTQRKRESFVLVVSDNDLQVAVNKLLPHVPVLRLYFLRAQNREARPPPPALAHFYVILAVAWNLSRLQNVTLGKNNFLTSRALTPSIDGKKIERLAGEDEKDAGGYCSEFLAKISLIKSLDEYIRNEIQSDIKVK